jgi:hypothetical protein
VSTAIIEEEFGEMFTEAAHVMHKAFVRSLVVAGREFSLGYLDLKSKEAQNAIVNQGEDDVIV